MTLGIVARCDTGGLAALTREVHRHLHPERTLLVDLEERGRGECTPDEYATSNTYRVGWKGALPDNAIEWATADEIDTLWTAEFWYDDRLLRESHGRHINTVCYAMPELSSWAVPGDVSPRPRELHVPTWWRLDTLPNARLLPFPIARDRLPYRQRTEVRHLYHPAGVAMMDRNGTQLLLDALPFLSIAYDYRLTIRADRPVDVPLGTNVDIEVVTSDAAEADYWNVCPADADLLVIPRRYGGLCLPLQECASLGLPAVTLASDPYAQNEFVTSIPTTGSHAERMKGGLVPVHSADPRALAAAIDYLAAHPAVVTAASREADTWAEENAWDGRLGEAWARLLR